MDIIVLIKQVPNTTEVKLDAKTGNLIREGLDSIMNPDDRHALEAALRLRENHPGKVTAISMGPSQAIEVLTEAVGMGADHGILLSDRAFAGADTWATSLTLGKAIEKIGRFDLVLCGRQAIDGDTAQIGPQVAEYLKIPQVTYVFEVEESTETGLTVKRRLENGYQRVQCRLPALLTVMGELNRPRRAHVGRLIGACQEKAPLSVWNAADIGVTVDQVGLAGSLTHVIKTHVPDFKRQGEMLAGTPSKVVDQLLQRLGQSPGASACKAVAAACRLS